MGRPKKKKDTVRSDGRYEAKITLGRGSEGKPIIKHFYSDISTADARKKANDYKVEWEIANRTGGTVDLIDTPFEKWAEIWLETYKKGKVKNNTYYGSYQIPVERHLIPYFKGCGLKSIKPVDVQRFFDYKGKSCSAESIKKMRACLKAIFDTGIDNDLCFKNPVKKNLTITSSIDPISKRAYTQSEYDKILEFAKRHENGLSIILLMETGMSRSELLGIKWENIDFENSVINLVQGSVVAKNPETEQWGIVTDGLKNEYRSRPVPVKSWVADLLKAQPRTIWVGGNKRKGLPPFPVQTEFVIHSPEGKVFDPNHWHRRLYKPFMEDMHAAHPDIPILNPHELRHTRATLWKNDGVDIFTIAKLLGHADLEMLSKKYAHNDIGALKKALGY